VFSTYDLKSACYQVPFSPEDKIYTAFEAAGKLYQYCRLPFGVINGVAAFQRIIDRLITKNKLSNTYAYLDYITIAGVSEEGYDKNVHAFVEVAKQANLTFS